MKEEYKDIAPYDDTDFQPIMAELVKEPGFENAIRYVMPDANYSEMAEELLKVKGKEEFQQKVMFPILNLLEQKQPPELPNPAWITSSRNITCCSSRITATLCWTPRFSALP